MAHGRLYRHPLATTWISSISLSPGDVRSGLNAGSELRNGYREALSYLEKLISSDLETLNVDDTKVTNLDDALREIYVAVPAVESAAPGQKAKADDILRDPTCDCDLCTTRRAIEAINDLGEASDEGNRALFSSIRRAQRDDPTLSPARVLQSAGIPSIAIEPLRVAFVKNMTTLPIPITVGQRINAWVVAERERRRTEKEAKRGKRESKAPSLGEQVTAFMASGVPDATVETTPAMLNVINEYRRETDGKIANLVATVRHARLLIEQLEARPAAPVAEIEDLRKQVVDLTAVRDQHAACAVELEGVKAQLAAAQAAAADHKAKLSAMLSDLMSRIENVRTLRMADDLHAIGEKILDGAIALSVDLQVPAKA